MEYNNWNVSIPQKDDIDESRINELIDFIKKENKPIHSLTIIKNGNLIKDISFNGYSTEEKHAIT